MLKPLKSLGKLKLIVLVTGLIAVTFSMLGCQKEVPAAFNTVDVGRCKGGNGKNSRSGPAVRSPGRYGEGTSRCRDIETSGYVGLRELMRRHGNWRERVSMWEIIQTVATRPTRVLRPG